MKQENFSKISLLKWIVCGVILISGSDQSLLFGQASSPLKQADILFGKGEFVTAAKAYKKLSNSSTPKKELYGGR